MRDRRSSIGDDTTGGIAGVPRAPSARVIQAAGLAAHYQANGANGNHDVAVMMAIISVFDDAVTEVLKLLSHNSYTTITRICTTISYHLIVCFI